MQMDRNHDEPDAVVACLSFRALPSGIDVVAAANDHSSSTLDDEFDFGFSTKISAALQEQALDEHEEIGDRGAVQQEEEEDFKGGSFRFAFVIDEPKFGPADEIFSGGRIRPVYPVFDRSLLFDEEKGEGKDKGEPSEAVRGQLRRLFLEDREETTNPGSYGASFSSESSEADELEGIPAGTYCIWTPGASSPSASPSPSQSPARCKKSGSTGSLLRWRLRDLVVRRSQSDGKEKFVFLAAVDEKKKPAEKKMSEEKKKKKPSSAVVAAENKKKEAKTGKKMDVVTAHRIFYGQSPASPARQSFLPYRRGIIGFLAGVNGLSRSYHPM